MRSSLDALNYAVIIPARYQSSRLPGKPLVELCGIPMVIRTYHQCAKACPPERIYVATDDDRIASVCRARGVRVLMTSPDCLTGTDRVAECTRYLDADVFVNVQGDEPVFNPDDLRRMLASIVRFPGEVLNGFCCLSREEAFRSSSTPKVVTRLDGRLLYMSRSAMPTNKMNAFIKGWRQVCIYGFPRAALSAFAAERKKTPLEAIEDIEILRFLEMGWEVRMIEMSEASIAVDNPDDIAQAEAVIRERGL